MASLAGPLSPKTYRGLAIAPTVVGVANGATLSSPIPLPWCRRDRTFSIRLNGWQRFAIRSFGMPVLRIELTWVIHPFQEPSQANYSMLETIFMVNQLLTAF